MCGAGRRFLLRGQADVGDKESVPGPQKTKPFDRQLMDGQVRVAYVSDGSKGIVRCALKLSLIWQRRWLFKAQSVARQAAPALE